jgi:hypothetical protein
MNGDWQKYRAFLRSKINNYKQKDRAFLRSNSDVCKYIYIVMCVRVHKIKRFSGLIVMCVRVHMMCVRVNLYNDVCAFT